MIALGLLAFVPRIDQYPAPNLAAPLRFVTSAISSSDLVYAIWLKIIAN